MVVCIAGKNSIAVNAAAYVQRHHPEWQLRILANRTDKGFDTCQPSIKKWALNSSAKLVLLEDLYQLQDLVFVSLEYDRLIAPETFKTKRLFNIHFSLLPAYKGAYTSIWPILDGRDHTGVTLHEIDRGIDTGDIISQVRIPILPEDNSGHVYARYLEVGFDLFAKWIPRLVSGEYEAAPQVGEGSSFHSRNSIDFTALRIDLKQTASYIHDQVRAFAFREYQLPVVHGFPVCYSESLRTRSKVMPGTIIADDDDTLSVASIDFDVRIYKDQFTSLLAACRNGSAKKVRGYVGKVENLEARSPEGWTPLIVAAFHGNVEVVKCLLDLHVDVNQPNYRGTPPLMYAMTPAQAGNLECLRLLLERGANLNARDMAGRTAFSYAHERGWTEVTTLLKVNGAAE